MPRYIWRNQNAGTQCVRNNETSRWCSKGNWNTKAKWCICTQKWHTVWQDSRILNIPSLPLWYSKHQTQNLLWIWNTYQLLVWNVGVKRMRSVWIHWSYVAFQYWQIFTAGQLHAQPPDSLLSSSSSLFPQIIQEFNQQLFMQENPVFHKAHDFQFQPSECDTVRHTRLHTHPLRS